MSSLVHSAQRRLTQIKSMYTERDLSTTLYLVRDTATKSVPVHWNGRRKEFINHVNQSHVPGCCLAEGVPLVQDVIALGTGAALYNDLIESDKAWEQRGEGC
jgi:hypothetical protein